MTRGTFLLSLGTLAGQTGARSKPAAVKRWDVITIGNLSRNRYWGEPDTKPLRSAICTCTLVTGENFRLLVDPSIADRDEMWKELDRRTGVRPEAVSAVFVTHEHADHWFGLAHFPNAQWWAAAPVAKAIAAQAKGKLPREIETAPELLFGAVEVFPSPGHTPTHHSLRFECEGLSVVAAGDAVATRDYWKERRSYYNVIDAALAAKTMDHIAQIADVVVPGHDNYFAIRRG